MSSQEENIIALVCEMCSCGRQVAIGVLNASHWDPVVAMETLNLSDGDDDSDDDSDTSGSDNEMPGLEGEGVIMGGEEVGKVSANGTSNNDVDNNQQEEEDSKICAPENPTKITPPPPPEDPWDCNRCTLANPPLTADCLACGLPYTENTPPSQTEATTDAAFNGAAIGTLIGGTHAWMNNESVARGALGGAFGGAAMGAIAGAVMSGG